MTRSAICIAIAAAVAAFVVGVRFGTNAAGGSDSACYLSEARMLARGSTRFEQPLARAAPWPSAAWTFTPAGHMPASTQGEFVPMCPPGLPLAMVPLRWLRVDAFVAVPIFGALAVCLAFVVGRRLGGPLVGAASSLLTLCSPIFLYQLVQPMTDVPATAWWLLAVALVLPREDGSPRPFAGGLAASMAILTRPNLAPLAGIVAIWLGATGRMGRILWFAAGVAPGILVLAALQQRMYGSPFATGYGPAETLFDVAHFAPNARRYAAWTIETHTPFLLFAVGAPFVARDRAGAWLCLALAAATIAVYLPYRVFDDWWYIRFLLPAVPLLVALSLTAVAGAGERLAPQLGGATWIAAVIVLCAWWLHVASARHVFELRDWERHFVEAGTYVADRLPARAAVLTVKHSGSVHFYAERPIIAWNLIDPADLDRVAAFLDGQGYVPYLVIDIEEENAFRARFGRASALGGLDWPPVARVGHAVRVYGLRDRARFLAGETIPTETVAAEPARRRRG